MAKEKLKIDFRGKEMNVLESKLYLLGIKLNLVDIKLDENEKRDYYNWLSLRKNRNEIAIRSVGKKIYKHLDEKDYIIESLEMKIDSIESKNRKGYLEGHKPKNDESSQIFNPFSSK